MLSAAGARNMQLRVRNAAQTKYPQTKCPNRSSRKAVEVKENHPNGLRRSIPTGSSERHHAHIKTTKNNSDSDIAKHERHSMSVKQEDIRGSNDEIREKGIMVLMKPRSKDNIDKPKQNIKQEGAKGSNAEMKEKGIMVMTKPRSKDSIDKAYKRAKEGSHVEKKQKGIIAEMKHKSKDSADKVKQKSKLGVDRVVKLGGTNMTQRTHQNKPSVNKRPRAPKPLPSRSLFQHKPRNWFGGKIDTVGEAKEDWRTASGSTKTHRATNKSNRKKERKKQDLRRSTLDSSCSSDTRGEAKEDWRTASSSTETQRATNKSSRKKEHEKQDLIETACSSLRNQQRVDQSRSVPGKVAFDKNHNWVKYLVL